MAPADGHELRPAGPCMLDTPEQRSAAAHFKESTEEATPSSPEAERSAGRSCGHNQATNNLLDRAGSITLMGNSPGRRRHGGSSEAAGDSWLGAVGRSQGGARQSSSAAVRVSQESAGADRLRTPVKHTEVRAEQHTQTAAASSLVAQRGGKGNASSGADAVSGRAGSGRGTPVTLDSGRFGFVRLSPRYRLMFMHLNMHGVGSLPVSRRKYVLIDKCFLVLTKLNPKHVHGAFSPCLAL